MIFAVAVIAVTMAMQPAKAPEEQGTTKSESAKNATNSGSSSKPRQPTQTSNPSAAPAPAASASESPGKASQPNTIGEAENVRIQRRMEIFTGVLAGVALLQALLTFLTWLVYRRQAREMRRQRHEMRRQRHVMYRQWQAMREQQGTMGGQLKAIQDQIALEKAQLKQWVEIKDWEIEETIDHNRLWIKCKLTNPPKLLLTVRKVKYRGPYGEMPAYDPQWALRPDGGWCPAQFPIILGGQALEAFDRNKLEFGMTLTVDFDDAFGARQSGQRFSYRCVCGRERGCIFSPAWGEANPSEDQEAS